MRLLIGATLLSGMWATNVLAAPVIFTLGGTFYDGAPQYEVVADDVVVGIGTVAAERNNVASFEIGDPQQLSIRFVNDFAGPKGADGKRPPGTDRNLIIQAVEFNGEHWLGKQLVGPAGVSKSGDSAVVAINQTVPVFDRRLFDAAQCDGVDVHITGFEKGRMLPNDNVLDALDKVIVSTGCSAIITGYSSTNGPAEANKDIATKRAQAVLDYLVSKGAKFAAVDLTGWGETTLFGPDEAENRRVVISLHQ